MKPKQNTPSQTICSLILLDKIQNLLKNVHFMNIKKTVINLEIN